MICQNFKKRKTLYGHLPPKNIAEINPWDLVHVNQIGLYGKSIRNQHPGGAIVKNNVNITCMTMIDPTMGWSKIVEIPTYELNDVMGGNDEYIYK